MLADRSWVPGHIVNDVLFGRREHLFLAQGAHRVMDRVLGDIPVPEQAFASFENNIRARRRRCDELKKRYFHIVFPDKQTVLVDEWPLAPPQSLSRRFESRIGSLDDKIIYLHKSFENKSDLYKRTDTHMTDKGTIIAASRLLDALRLEGAGPIVEGLLNNLGLSRNHVGDLGSKLEPVMATEELFFNGALKAKYFSNSITGGNNGVVDIHIAAEPVAKERVLLFGDSFGRDLCRFLGALFSEVVFLRTQFFHEELVGMIDPDLVITQNIERYMHHVVYDEQRESFFMFPYFNNAEYNPGPEFAKAFSAMLSFPRSPYRKFMQQLRSGA